MQIQYLKAEVLGCLIDRKTYRPSHPHPRPERFLLSSGSISIRAVCKVYLSAVGLWKNIQFS